MADEADPPTETVEELPVTPPPPEPPAAPDPNERIEGMSKSLQRVTQELAQLKRKAEQQDGDLNEVQEAKRKTAAAEAQRLKNELEQYAAAGADGDEGIDQKLTKKVLAQEARLEKLEAENRALQAKAAAPTQAQIWANVAAEHFGGDVKAAQTEWEKALKEADKSNTVVGAKEDLEAGIITQEVFDRTYERAARDIFHPRAQAAKKPKPPTAAPPPPIAPSGKRSAPITGEPAPTVEHDDLYQLGDRITAEIMKAEGRSR